MRADSGIGPEGCGGGPRKPGPRKGSLGAGAWPVERDGTLLAALAAAALASYSASNFALACNVFAWASAFDGAESGPLHVQIDL